jgi:predicted DNA-binding transcriptional regulator AlpA
MQTKDSIEFRRLVDKSGLRRIEVAKYLGIGERTFYTYQNGGNRIPASVFIALKVLVKEV